MADLEKCAFYNLCVENVCMYFIHVYVCMCLYLKATGKFSVRLVPDQNPAEIGQLVITHLESAHRKRGSPNLLT